jgi:hypothetical protein
MTDNRLNRLVSILSQQAESYDISAQMQIAEHAIDVYEKATGDTSLTIEYDDKGNYYITKGVADVYPTIVGPLRPSA